MKKLFSLRCLIVASLFCLSVPLSLVRAQEIQVLPYVQPGDGRDLNGTDVRIIRWLTDQTPGDFVVEYGVKGGEPRRATVKRDSLNWAPEKGKAKNLLRYTAYLDSLPFNSDIHYSVKLGSKVIREATFRSRATADRTVRCALAGDLATGGKKPPEVAFRIRQQNPHFFMALGDIVYTAGRGEQYMGHFFPVYNDVAQPSLATGAPLMATIPFYPVVGNHDVYAGVTTSRSGMGMYQFFATPRNGPGEGRWMTNIGTGKEVEAFKKLHADGYPHLDVYSFDNGPAHFTVVNSNYSIVLDDPTLNAWIKKDLTSTKAAWKFVCFHIPPFQSTAGPHQKDQQMRRLIPLLQECGVDMTFGGHVHNYQRTVPLKFTNIKVQKGSRRVDGDFTLDKKFDGIKNTRPNGIIHVVCGSGGVGLTTISLEKSVASLTERGNEKNYVPYTAKYYVEQHAFVLMDISPDQIHYRAIAADGYDVDRMTITRGK